MVNTNFKFRQDFIKENILSDIFLQKALDRDGQTLSTGEIFVRHPDFENYYVSNYGRIISIAWDSPKFLGLFLGGINCSYLYCTFSEDGEKHTIGVHRAVAQTFCPNFWDNEKVQAHHVNKITTDNNYRNLILLPPKLHKACERIKKMVLLKDDQIIHMQNPLDLVYETGLTLEEIILANQSDNKPLQSIGGYTVFDIKGNLIGYKYYPEKQKK